MHQQHQTQKARHDQHTKPRHFAQGNLVFIHDFHKGATKPTWLRGTVIEQDGGPNYEIQLSDNQIVRRHADHIRGRESDCEDVTLHEEDDELPPLPVGQSSTSVKASIPMELRRSQRVRKPPKRFQS